MTILLTISSNDKVTASVKDRDNWCCSQKRLIQHVTRATVCSSATNRISARAIAEPFRRSKETLRPLGRRSDFNNVFPCGLNPASKRTSDLVANLLRQKGSCPGIATVCRVGKLQRRRCRQ